MSSREPSWPEPDRALFSISVAAELAGVHPQTLRSYEREGLILPARSAGGTRKYSPREIDRLREIADLASAGINIAGVRRILSLEGQVRRLEAEVSRVVDLEEEVARLRAELDEAVGGGAAQAANPRPGTLDHGRSFSRRSS